MVEELAQMAIQRKMELQASILLGNYEMYYAAGWIAGRTGKAPTDLTDPKRVWEETLAAGFSPSTPGEEHLVEMLKAYKPKEEYDDQMASLFQKGQRA